MSTVPILIDTSVLMASAKDKVDIRQELDRLGVYGPVSVFAGTLRELDTLAQGTSKTAQTAMLARQLTTHLQPTVLEDTTSHVDDDIVAYASAQPCVVCVQDKDLKKRLQNTTAKIVTVRQRTHLTVI